MASDDSPSLILLELSIQLRYESPYPRDGGGVTLGGVRSSPTDRAAPVGRPVHLRPKGAALKHVLNEVEAARLEGNLILGEGVAMRQPIALSLIAVGFMLQKRGLPLPDDALAWLSNGKISDKMIKNPLSVDGL